MLLHRELDDASLAVEALERKLKESETSYENTLKIMVDKDRIIDDLKGEAESLRIQVEQLMLTQPTLKVPKQTTLSHLT
jgi:hypothetical protein